MQNVELDIQLKSQLWKRFPPSFLGKTYGCPCPRHEGTVEVELYEVATSALGGGE